MNRRHDNRPAVPFPGAGPILAARTRGAALSVTRMTIADPAGDIARITMPAEDAFVVLFQLTDHAPHEFRSDGNAECVGPIARDTLNIVDVKGQPEAIFRQPVDTLMFHLPRAALDELAEDAGAARVSALVAPDPWHTQDTVVSSVKWLVVNALEAAAPANRLFHDHLLLGIGAHFAATYGGMLPIMVHVGGLAPWQERRALELLAANLAKQLSLQAIAHECGLSLPYFSRAFKRSLGTTPHMWLQARRIETARRLLADPSASLAAVALACGFADQSHFTRVFARLTGVTPGAWQRRR